MNNLSKQLAYSPSSSYFKECIDQTLGGGIAAGKKISMNWLVDALNYPNRKKLERDFRRYLNTTYRVYIMEKRLSMASKMLCHDGLSVKAVALSSGFSNSATFCNAFKRQFGAAPSEYRVDMYKEFVRNGCPYENQPLFSSHN
ncbi:helix-turn-helix domain-containing protein [Pseudoalteromonas shioyasakiensis]|uniref:helix-turn-helix domain-containing protein n=1 Tax=Pseudoalteromonas shioyasakiensis TaxID=1190813 RepID=UPI002551DB2C|nr:helix-turn-helix transcriptional regulator [Pseudoalteromonas shioyasakiensis]MDK9683258.1 helix-turn-helix transcriptional regulator [Pseudoalteromonas shioyasakiensis]